MAAGWITGPTTFNAGLSDEESVNLPLQRSAAYLARFDDAGSLIWLRHAPAVTSSGISAISSRPDGTLAVTGSYRGDTTFGSGEANETILSSDYDDIFTATFVP